MNISITGLPEGQKIKHINVDITFDEGGAISQSTGRFDTPSPDPTPVNEPPSTIIVEQAGVGIPSTMMDETF